MRCLCISIRPVYGVHPQASTCEGGGGRKGGRREPLWESGHVTDPGARAYQGEHQLRNDRGRRWRPRLSSCVAGGPRSLVAALVRGFEDPRRRLRGGSFAALSGSTHNPRVEQGPMDSSKKQLPFTLPLPRQWLHNSGEWPTTWRPLPLCLLPSLRQLWAGRAGSSVHRPCQLG